MKSFSHRLEIGDILEVRTSRGLAYVQYTHYKKPYGALIRVLSGFYQHRPVDFSRIANEKELYFVFCPVGTLVGQKLLEVVSHQSIPESSQAFPRMRKQGFVRPISKGGGVSHWIILDGEEESRVDQLTAEQCQLSIASSWNLGMLVKRLTEEWRPAMDLGLPNTAQDSQSDSPKIKGAKHFLYFESEAAARQVHARLVAGGWSTEVKRSARGDQWLVLVSDPDATESSLAKARKILEDLAIKFGGEYDGWEMGMG